MRESALYQAAALDSRFTAIAQVARSTASLLKEIDAYDDDALKKVISNSLTQNPLIYSASIFYVSSVRTDEIYVDLSIGEARIRSPAEAKINYTTQRWFGEVIKRNRPRWSGPYIDAYFHNAKAVTYSVPFQGPDNAQGVVSVDVLLENVNPNPQWEGLWGGYARLIDEKGNYLSPLPPVERTPVNLRNNVNLFRAAEALNLPELIEAGLSMVGGESGVVRMRDPLDGKGMFWLAYAPVSSTGWSLVALVDEGKVLHDVYDHLQWHLLIALVILCLILIAIILITRHLTQPLVRLNQVAHAVGQGNLALRVGEIGAKDEIGNFAQVFDRMLDDLQVAMADRMHEAEARQAILKEMTLARDIQRNLLPSSRPVFGSSVDDALYALCKPAAMMSGDFYDYFMLDGDTLVLVIADVCGKGMSAALYMALIRTTLRNFSVAGQSPGKTVHAANKALAQQNPDAMFASLFLAHYDLPTGLLRYVCAGHPSPFLRRRNGDIQKLNSSGALLGVFADEQYIEQGIVLQPGDALLLYTDGVTEAGTCKNDPYEEERLKTLMHALANKPVDEAAEDIAATVMKHADGEQEDDITLMILRRQSLTAA
ncbi:SpoIIE family protein phosphatase [Pseudochelatococcus sp. G4_1912]|uniref:SpoIIE family protein phosphatase n=1 Tax=Pseudochelatococcus sp. G4_1912 TaxID=3114288 RepID=UPI0039C6E82F